MSETISRRQRLLPGGIPKWVRIYDLGENGGCADRYTVVFSHTQSFYPRGFYPYLAMSGAPFHPQGVCLHGETTEGPCDTLIRGRSRRWPPAVGRKCHLGLRIGFMDLPEDCRKAALASYIAYWGLEEAT